MNALTALLQFLLALFGLDLGGNTIVDRISIDGIDTLYSKAHVENGIARFECLRSASGQCHYTLFPRECVASGSAAARPDDCLVRPVERFVVAKGDSRQVVGLTGFHLCVSTEDERLQPDCAVPKPMASR